MELPNLTYKIIDLTLTTYRVIWSNKIEGKIESDRYIVKNGIKYDVEGEVLHR